MSSKTLIMVSCILYCQSLLAGVWGNENWGRMYWGSNTATSPVEAPLFNITVDGTDISLVLTNLLTGADMGWSVVTHFVVTCGDSDPVTINALNPELTGLEPNTDYTCSIVAWNDEGASTASEFAFTTEETISGLPIWLLYQATQT